MVMKPKSSGYIKKLSDVQAMSGAKVCLLEAMSGMYFMRESYASIFRLHRARCVSMWPP